MSSCFIFSFSGLARASMMQSEDRVKENSIEPHCLQENTHMSVVGSVNKEGSVKDTGQDIIVEGCEVFQGVHHWYNEVVVPLNLRQHLIHKQERGGDKITIKDIQYILPGSMPLPPWVAKQICSSHPCVTCS